MQKRQSIAALALLVVAAGAGMPAPAAAQDLKYESVTRVDLPGVAGTIMRAATRLGGGSTEQVETTWISGQRIRTDADKSSTILDMAEGRMLMLDHDSRTYMEISLAAGLEGVRQAAEQARAERAQADGRMERGEAEAEVRVDFRLDVDRTGQRERIAGYEAERVFLTMQAVTETAEAGRQAERSGTFVVLTEAWNSSTAPMAQAYRAMGDASGVRDYADAASTLMEVLTEAFAEDPRFRAAFDRAADEANRIDGVAMRTITRFVAVAPEAEFDRALALGERSEGPGLAQQAGRAALGGLARRAAGLPGRQQQAAEEPAEPTQQTVITITSEIRNVSTGPVDPALFTVPEGYTRVNDR
jgi:hypothetical protein